MDSLNTANEISTNLDRIGKTVKSKKHKDIDDTIQRLEDLATLVKHKPTLFLINYLKANIDDIKDAYEAT